MYQIIVTFTAVSSPLSRHEVTGKGLAGLTFKLLDQVDVAEATWLHEQPPPKPYSMAPIFTNKLLTGLRFGVLTERTAVFLHRAWKNAVKNGDKLRLGPHRLIATYVQCRQGPGFAEMLENDAAADLRLRFLTPTTFSQSTGVGGKPIYLLLPEPRNVFTQPFRVWQTFAPPPKKLPADWPEWCARQVLVSRHQIQTEPFVAKKGNVHLGFTGDVAFLALAEEPFYRQIWQALGQLAVYSGVGAKTALGFGAVTYHQGGK
ncbi:MAG: CRISPR-associated endoribonuclease Cas6 [Anaerolineae bacterium]|nr:CRISPR-associated endoribonuclease Cas6 [Anaerolineae bacterium]